MTVVSVYAVFASADEAERIGRQMVEERLAACVNILPKARSIYRWEGKLEESAEWLLLIKSRRDLFTALRAEIQRMHTYEVPEVIAIPVVDGSEAYLEWLDAQLITPAE